MHTGLHKSERGTQNQTQSHLCDDEIGANGHSAGGFVLSQVERRHHEVAGVVVRHDHGPVQLASGNALEDLRLSLRSELGKVVTANASSSAARCFVCIYRFHHHGKEKLSSILMNAGEALGREQVAHLYVKPWMM